MARRDCNIHNSPFEVGVVKHAYVMLFEWMLALRMKDEENRDRRVSPSRHTASGGRGNRFRPWPCVALRLGIDNIRRKLTIQLLPPTARFSMISGMLVNLVHEFMIMSKRYPVSRLCGSTSSRAIARPGFLFALYIYVCMPR